jgi:hypothetical protein
MGKTDAPFDLATAGAWRGSPDCKIGQCFRIAENQHRQSNTQQACIMQGFPFPMDGFNSTSPNANAMQPGYWNWVLDSYPHVHGSPVVWKRGNNDFNLYVWPEEDFLKAYHFDGQKFLTSPVASSKPENAATMSMPGGILSLSWDGANPNTAILWASRPKAGLPDCMFTSSNPFDLTPNDAPCSAINKIVHGYLQAFDTTPRDGMLKELWNSESNQNDSIEWFSKESPPTIADSKVFIAEFPPKPTNSDWNSNKDFGSLLMYSSPAAIPPPVRTPPCPTVNGRPQCV